LRRFLVDDVDARSAWECPACERQLELMVRSIPGPPAQTASALGATLMGSSGGGRSG
jgi:hypothetical protein